MPETSVSKDWPVYDPALAILRFGDLCRTERGQRIGRYLGGGVCVARERHTGMMEIVNAAAPNGSERDEDAPSRDILAFFRWASLRDCEIPQEVAYADGFAPNALVEAVG